MQDLGELRDHRRSRSSSCAPLAPNGLVDIAPGPGPEVDAGLDPQGLDLQAPPGREVAGRLAVHLGRRGRDDGAPGQGRQLGPQGRHRRRVGASRRTPNTVTFNLQGANGNFPYLVSVFNAQTLITPAALCRRDDAGQAARPGPVRGSSMSYDIASGRQVRPERRVVGRQDATRRAPNSPSSTTRARWSPPIRAARSMPSSSSTSCPARRCSTTPNFTVVDTPTTNHREIWMRCDTGQFADKRVRQALALTIDRPALIQQLFKGKGELGQRPRHLAALPVLQRRRPAARAGHRQGKAAAGGRRQVRPEGHPPVRQAPRDPRPRRPAAEPGRPGRDHAHAGRSRDNDPFYDAAVVPAEARRSAVLRRCRVRHRGLRPPRHPGRLPQLGAQDARASGTRRSTRPRRSMRRSRNSRAPSASTRRRPPAPRSRRSWTRMSPSGHPVLLQLPLRQLEEVHGRLHLRARTDVPLGRLEPFSTDHAEGAGGPGVPVRIPEPG